MVGDPLFDVFVPDPDGGAVRSLAHALLLYGGRSATGEHLDDLWLLDLDDEGACPWTLLTDDASPWSQVADGALVADGADVYLVGGRRFDARWSAVPEVMVLDGLDTASPSFVTTGWLQGFEATAATVGSPTCSGHPWDGAAAFDCVCDEPGGCSVTDPNTGYPVYGLAEGALATRWRFGVTATDLASRRAAMCAQAPGEGADWATATCASHQDCYDHAGYGSDFWVSGDLLCEEAAADPAAITCHQGCPWKGSAYEACPDDPLCDPASELASLPGGDVGVVHTRSDWPGQWSSGVTFDPTTAQIQLYGGTTGCEAVDCPPEIGADGVARAESLTAYNRPGGWVWDLDDGTYHPFSVDEPTDAELVADETTGVRGGAVALFGVSWDHVEREWVRGSQDELLVGGTFDQDVAPARLRQLDGPQDQTEAWTTRRHGEAPALRLRTAATTDALATFVPPGTDVAASHAGPDAVVVVTPADGHLRVVDRDGAVLHDVGFAQISGRVGVAWDPITERVITVGDVDDLLRGADDDGRVRTFRTSLRSAPPNLPAADTWITRAETRITMDAPDAADPVSSMWTVEQAFQFQLDCRLEEQDPAEGCNVGALWIRVAPAMVPDGDPARGIAPMTAWLTLPDGRQLELLADRAAQQADQWRAVRLRTPVQLYNDAKGRGTPVYELHVIAASSPKDGRPRVDPVTGRIEIYSSLNPSSHATWAEVGEDNLEPEVGVSPPCGRTLVLSEIGLPVRLGGASPGTEHVDDRAWSSVEVGLPDDVDGYPGSWEVVGPQHAPTCPSTSLLAPWPGGARRCFDLDVPSVPVHPDLASRFAFQVRQATLPPVQVFADDGAPSWLWEDACLSATAHGIVSTFATNNPAPAVRSYTATRAFLAARVASPANEGRERRLGLWVGRQTDGDPTLGIVSSSLIQLAVFPRDGSVLLGADTAAALLSQTATHELTHWVVARRGFDDAGGTGWLREAPATLMGWIREPGVRPHELRNAITVRTAAFARDDGSPVARRASLDLTLDLDQQLFPNLDDSLWYGLRRSYLLGPSLLAQAFTVGGEVQTWNQWRDTVLAAGDAGSLLTAAEVDGFFATLGLTDFGGKRVRGQALGEPLVSVEVERDPAGAPIRVHARQLQDERLETVVGGLPFEELPDVPWALGCAELVAGEIGVTAPFVECDVVGLTTASALRTLPGGGVEADLPLTPTAVADPTTAWFAGFSGGTMLPGNLGSYGLLSGNEPAVSFTSFDITCPNPDPGLPPIPDCFDGVPEGYLNLPPAAPTWWLSCGPASTDPRCADPDADGDGFVASGDCDDADPTVFPGAPEPLGAEVWLDGGPDRDCDGWPLPFHLDPYGRIE